MAKQRVVKVAIEYERSVRMGSEQLLLRDILNDVALLKDDSPMGDAYRRIYGDKAAFDPAAAEKLVADGQTILVTPDATEGSSSYKVLSATTLVSMLGEAIPEGKLSRSDLPVDETGKQRNFLTTDLTLDKQGQWPSIDPKTGRTAQDAVQRVLGSTPVQMSPEDLKKVEKLRSDAKALGVTPDELVSMTFSKESSSKLAKEGKVSVWWRGTPIEDQTPTLAGADDTLRRTAPRPGGDEAPGASSLKEDNYAVLRVVSGFSPAAGDVLHTGRKFEVVFQTNKFLIDGVQESQAERIALVETFGETLLYAFGERPKMYAYSGTLLDTQGLNWLNEWREAYRTRFRATAALKLKARAFLIYRDVAREGIIVANLASISSAELGMGRFSFQMFVMNEYFLGGRPRIDGQLEMKSGLEKAPEAVDDQTVRYELASIVDVTPAAAAPMSQPNGTKIHSALSAAIAAEDAVAKRREGKIISIIKATAFPGGKYMQSSGEFSLSLFEADVDAAKYRFDERLQEEQFQGNLTRLWAGVM